MIAVAIVEDEPNELSSLRQVVEKRPGFRCSGAFRTAELALKQIRLTKPDVIIVDLGLPRMDGIRFIWELKRTRPKCEILVHSVEAHPRKVFQALQAGATGYLIKGATAEEIGEAIHDVHRGGSPMSPSIARLVIKRLQGKAAKSPGELQFTQRQEEVLRLIVEGRTTEETSAEQCISKDTVKTHIRHIYEALQLHSRAEVIAWWHGRHLEAQYSD